METIQNFREHIFVKFRCFTFMVHILVFITVAGSYQFLTYFNRSHLHALPLPPDALTFNPRHPINTLTPFEHVSLRVEF